MKVRDQMFRKAALSRLASPEQLDQLLETTTPGLWLALTAVLVLLGGGVVWTFKGSIPVKATGQGLLVRSGGILNLDSLGSGVVTKLAVRPGDRVQANQVVASIAQPELLQKIMDTRVLLREARIREFGALDLHKRASALQEAALERQRENAESRSVVLAERAQVLKQQIADQQELADSGIVTKYQVLEYQQKLVDVQEQIAAGEATIRQVEAQKFTAEAEPVETDQELKVRVLTLEADLRGMEQQLQESSSVLAPYGGEVLEVKASPGRRVDAGTPLLSIEPELRKLEVVAYVDSLEAKNVRTGMSAQISPSTVRREEFGFLRAVTLSVADFPATPESIMRNFENQSLVESVLHNGPVTEVRLGLLPDPKSPSQLLWSSTRNPAVSLSSGTLCTVAVVTKRQKPIALVLP